LGVETLKFGVFIIKFCHDFFYAAFPVLGHALVLVSSIRVTIEIGKDKLFVFFLLLEGFDFISHLVNLDLDLFFVNTKLNQLANLVQPDIEWDKSLPFH
jgi:hypothetical protein